MIEPEDTRTNERGIEEKKCPYCGDWKDPRGYSSHAENCPEKSEEENQERTRSEQNENMSNEEQNDEEYEEVTSGKQVEVNENPICDGGDDNKEGCGSMLLDAQKYASKLRQSAKDGEVNGQNIGQEERNYLLDIAEWCEDYYAVCPNCELGYEKTEL